MTKQELITQIRSRGFEASNSMTKPELQSLYDGLYNPDDEKVKPEKKVSSMLTPKNVILQAITSKLEGTGIKKMTLIFGVIDKKYNLIKVTDDNGEYEDIEIENSDINTIRTLFVNKLVKVWNKNYNEIINRLIILINIEAEDLQLFVETPEGKVLKFEY